MNLGSLGCSLEIYEPLKCYVKVCACARELSSEVLRSHQIFKQVSDAKEIKDHGHKMLMAM